MLTQEERAALNEKIKDPKAFVSCPRCGNSIEYQAYETAIRVYCATSGCIQATLRGI